MSKPKNNRPKDWKEDAFLARRSANHVPLSPLDFLKRSALVYPQKTAVVYNEHRTSYAALYRRCRQLASALANAGVAKGDTVAYLAPNIPPLLEAHYGVPMAGAVLNAINTRLDAGAIAFCLRHGEAKVLIADRDFAPLVKAAVAMLDNPPFIVDIVDPAGRDGHAEGMAVGAINYEDFIAKGDANFVWQMPDDEWQSIALNYTSGTTGDPKGVLYHHRGAYLNALGNIATYGVTPATRYLWTVPMFHCNGWTFPWAVTAVGATHVCLRQVDPVRIFQLVRDEGVSLFCAAPIVLNMLIHAPGKPMERFGHRVDVVTGGAAPPSIVISQMENLGFNVIHGYGLTETYGPSTICAWQDEWNALSLDERAKKVARQGVAMTTQHEVAVVDPETLLPVPADGTTQGEIVMRGNTVMKGYFKNEKGTGEAFKGGWFHSGDLAVLHADGYIEIKDRSKDIIISGGENISSLEVEEVLFRHPSVLEAAVVAKPDAKWGETPCAFVTLKSGAKPVAADDIIAWCREHLAAYKCPRFVVFAELPKTPTGKVQKFQLRDRARTM